MCHYVSKAERWPDTQLTRNRPESKGEYIRFFPRWLKAIGVLTSSKAGWVRRRIPARWLQGAVVQGVDSGCCRVLAVAAAGQDSEFPGCCCKGLLQVLLQAETQSCAELRRVVLQGCCRPRLRFAQGAGWCCWVLLQGAVAELRRVMLQGCCRPRVVLLGAVAG